MLRNCEECNRIFSHPTRTLCNECYEEAQRSFKAVKEYLVENPGASVARVAKETEVPVEIIYEYIQEGRLDVIPKDAVLKCAICGTAINVGRVCTKCRDDLRSTITTEQGKSRDSLRSRSRVHILDTIRGNKKD